MILLQLTCVALILMYVSVRLSTAEDRLGFLRRLGLLVVASWLAEDTCIHLYGFYAYSTGWSLFVDQLPLLVICIWPFVIHSAWDLCVWGLRGRADWRVVPLVGGLMVLADASLIEPISVETGLWWWTEPGLFEVPPIGILGWALFAALAIGVYEYNRQKGHGPLADLAVLVVAPIGTHLLLLAAWWGAFRWVNVEIPAWPVVAVAWVIAVGVAATMLRRRIYARIPLREMLLRIPAALFFFVLLALNGLDVPALVAYALAFAPPWCAATPWTARQRARVSDLALSGSGEAGSG